ncbi:MAG: Eco57I restriction-modification methylase domain-containing protein [Kiritimatiellia bacterium]
MSSSNIYNTRSSGRQHGDVFTKPDVVCYMLDLVGYVPERDLRDVSIMEPACGEGGFLMEILRRLQASAHERGFDFNEAFHRNVLAVDIDGRKIDSCLHRISRDYPGVVNPERNILVQDYLLSPHPKVDVVVGNPPYIRYEEIPADKVTRYKSEFNTFYYRSDLYVLFFEKTLRELNRGGRHCFICANRWMRNQYGKLLRGMLARSFRIERIIDMERVSAFNEDVLAYPAITLIGNDSRVPTFSYLKADDISTLGTQIGRRIATPEDEDWSRAFNDVKSAGGLSLIEEQGFKIGIGVATGADSIFISSKLANMVEDELLIPAINARDLQGNEMHWGGKFLLNPYNPDGSLIALDRYPKAKAYFERHRERLSRRHKARRNPTRWYGTIDRITPSLKRESKILLPDISGNTFVFVDDGNYYPQHNIYYITGGSHLQLKILAAFMMSDFVRKQLDNLANHMNGGYARWQSQYLRRLYVPMLSGIPKDLSADILRCYDDHDKDGIDDYMTRILDHERRNQEERGWVK